MRKSKGASIEFSLVWESEYGVHKERLLVPRVNFWRDFFPVTMGDTIEALLPGGNCSAEFAAGELVTPFSEKGITRFKEKCFEQSQDREILTPRVGRFYPQGIAWTGIGCLRGNRNPFRLIGLEKGVVEADTNHPLALYPLTLYAACLETRDAFEERGGMCHDIAETVTADGPGMQVPYCGVSTDFYAVYPFRRINERNDRLFYEVPRFVNHLDDKALSFVSEIYSKKLDAGSKVLDLMSSWNSHIPDELQCNVVGLGLNEEELDANRQLTGYVVHDLNDKPLLPFADREFDAVICTVSIEYLTRPLEIFRDIGRILKPGGVCIVSFSDRWFPGKQIVPWAEMHGFERLGLVFDYFLKTGIFDGLHTETVRGYPRPFDDPHRKENAYSDPVFAVWGDVKQL